MIGKSALAEEFWAYGKSQSCPIIDVHGHMGPQGTIYFPRNKPEDMIRTMDSAGVKLQIFSHHTALGAPDLGNIPSIEAVRAHPDRLRAYCVINPNYPDKVAQELATFKSLYRDVYVGIKFLSDYHKIALSDPGYVPAWEMANELECMLLAHTWGGSIYDGEKEVRKVAERYPKVKFLLGHSCHGSWDAAIQLAKDFPNVYLELTAVFDDRGVIDKFVNEAGSERMLFGTDLPWFDPHQAVGVLLDAHITDEDRHNICHRNAERLLKPILGDFISIE